MKSLIPYLFIVAFLIGCSKDDDPAGAAGALNKPFNLVLSGMESTIGYKLLVSPDGTKVLVGIDNDVNPGYHYSKDGGATFTAVAEVLNRNLRYAEELSSNGLVLTSQNQVYNMEGGAQVPVSGGEFVILGEKGKVFVYSHNYGTLSYKNVGEASFKEITKPVVANPGSANLYYAVKVPGKGVAFIASPGARADKTVSVYILDETAMTWTTHSMPLTWASINNCNNLMMSEKFVFGSSTTMIIKGCTGMAVMDLAKNETKYIKYPMSTKYPDQKLDGIILVDNSGTLYMMGANAYDTPYRFLQYKTDKWETAFDNLQTSPALGIDKNNNIYFNSVKGEGLVMKSPAKVNLQTGAKTLLGLPRNKEQITDAIALEDEVIVVCNGEMFRYDIAGSSVSNFGLTSITHFNILSDGRWVAGGGDVIHLSSDEGKTWTKTEKLFSPSLTQFQVGMNVTQTRLVNGQLLITGTSTYFYQNLTLGLTQTKHDNMVITLNGGKQNYQLPADFSPSVIAPDGTLYGTAEFVSDFGTTIDMYEIKPGVAPVRLPAKSGPIPQIITDDGLQMTLSGSKHGSGYDVHTRKSVEEAWTSSSDLLPNTSSVRIPQKLKAGGNGITFINGTEVYAAGN